MSQSKILSIIILLIILLVVSHTKTPLYSVIERDPPSPFNYGPGGISKFYIDEIYKRRVELIYTPARLSYYIPNRYALLIIGPDDYIEDYKEIFLWVGRGGITIVMDELNYSITLLNSLGIQQGSMYSTIAIGSCSIGNQSLNVLFNVFRVLEVNNSNASTLCLVNGLPTAFTIPYGNGTFIIFSDSSIVINNVMDSIYAMNNSLCIDYLIGGRGVIIYEGSRIYSTVEAKVIAYMLNTVFLSINMLITYLLGFDILRRVIAFLLVTCLVIIYIVNRFGFSRKLRIGLKITRDKKGRNVLVDDLMRGMSVWLKEIEE